MRYFLLNYLSFNSHNLVRLFTYMLRCSTHNMYEREFLDIDTAHGGYTVSANWKMLSDIYSDENTTFVLLKEDPRVVEDHVLYGYYNDFYDSYILHDYQKHLNLSFDPQPSQNIQGAAAAYYSEVENHFRGSSRFVIANMTKYGGSWNNWMLSDDFTTFVMTLPASDSTLHLKVPSMQRRVLAKKTFPYFDYLTPGPYYGVPTGMAVGVFFGGFPMPMCNDHSEEGHIDHMIKTYN